MRSGIKVVAPASVSNLACGFDTLGMALDIPCDEIIGRWSDTPGVKITELTGAKEGISKDLTHNTAAIAANAFLKHVGENGRGLELKIKKHIQGGSGLGSSAASAVAAVLLVNEMLNRPLEKRALIPFALTGEIQSSGSLHGDNVVPAMLGGLILIRDIQTLDYHRIYTPPGLFMSILLPLFLLPTKGARSILKPEVPLKDMIRQAANLGSLVIAMHNGDFDLMSRCMVDHIIEPQRKHLIPHLDTIKETALNMGALSCNISGAGPAIFALSTEKTMATEIADAMKKIYDSNHIESKVFVGGVNNEGAQLL